MSNRWIVPGMNSRENPSRIEEETNHHLMPSSRACDISKEVQIILFKTFHDSFHRIFGNGTPAEQIYRIMYINKPTLTDRFRKDLIDMLSDPEYVYEKGLWTPKIHSDFNSFKNGGKRGNK